MFRGISNTNYKNIFDNFITQLTSLPIRENLKFLNNLRLNQLTENSIFNNISAPFGVNWKFLCDTNLKRFFLIWITSCVAFYRWYKVIKIILLWPFKLGIFSFIYSVLGFDVMWFLNIFNVFSYNIPNWVYIQYLTLYSNWLDWWYNTVNIKTLKSISFPETKVIKQNITKDLNELEIRNPKNNNLWYAAGLITIIISPGELELNKPKYHKVKPIPLIKITPPTIYQTLLLLGFSIKSSLIFFLFLYFLYFLYFLL